jgi:hypothetical protein
VEAFGANRYEFPTTLSAFQEKIKDIEVRLEETKNVRIFYDYI